MSLADAMRAFYEAPLIRIDVESAEICVYRHEGYGHCVEKPLRKGFVDWKFDVPDACPTAVLKAIIADRERT